MLLDIADHRAHGAAPAAAMVRNAGAGNHWRRTNPSNAETHAPREPELDRNKTATASASLGQGAASALRRELAAETFGGDLPTHVGQ